MPPKSKVTKEMIIDAAFELVRESGIESVNARAIAARLGCSTQPVLYWFETVEEIRQRAFERADAFQTEYIMGAQDNSENPMLGIGVAYVRFAATEKNLFRFLFQSDHFAQQTLEDLVNDEETKPLLMVLAQTLGTDEAGAKDAFVGRFLMVHGMASMLANNSMIYNEDDVLRLLSKTFEE